MLSGKLPPGHAPPLPLFTLRAGLTQSQTGVQGALGLLCSGGRAYTAWAGLVSFFADALLKKKYRENIARTLHVIVGCQCRHCDKNLIYCAALACIHTCMHLCTHGCPGHTYGLMQVETNTHTCTHRHTRTHKGCTIIAKMIITIILINIDITIIYHDYSL